jgi:hypothetical protein
MNMHTTLSRIFPSGVVSAYASDTGGSFEVRGLTNGAVPQNCEVLARGRARSSHWDGHRASYLVRTEDFVLFFRICLSVPGKDRGGSGVSRGYAHANDGQSRGLQVHACRAIAALCADDSRGRRQANNLTA